MTTTGKITLGIIITGALTGAGIFLYKQGIIKPVSIKRKELMEFSANDSGREKFLQLNDDEINAAWKYIFQYVNKDKIDSTPKDLQAKIIAITNKTGLFG